MKILNKLLKILTCFVWAQLTLTEMVANTSRGGRSSVFKGKRTQALPKQSDETNNHKILVSQVKKAGALTVGLEQSLEKNSVGMALRSGNFKKSTQPKTSLTPVKAIKIRQKSREDEKKEKENAAIIEPQDINAKLKDLSATTKETEQEKTSEPLQRLITSVEIAEEGNQSQDSEVVKIQENSVVDREINQKDISFIVDSCQEELPQKSVKSGEVEVLNCLNVEGTDNGTSKTDIVEFEKSSVKEFTDVDPNFLLSQLAKDSQPENEEFEGKGSSDLDQVLNDLVPIITKKGTSFADIVSLVKSKEEEIYGDPKDCWLTDAITRQISELSLGKHQCTSISTEKCAEAARLFLGVVLRHENSVDEVKKLDERSKHNLAEQFFHDAVSVILNSQENNVTSEPVEQSKIVETHMTHIKEDPFFTEDLDVIEEKSKADEISQIGESKTGEAVLTVVDQFSSITANEQKSGEDEKKEKDDEAIIELQDIDANQKDLSAKTKEMEQEETSEPLQNLMTSVEIAERGKQSQDLEVVKIQENSVVDGEISKEVDQSATDSFSQKFSETTMRSENSDWTKLEQPILQEVRGDLNVLPEAPLSEIHYGQQADNENSSFASLETPVVVQQLEIKENMQDERPVELEKISEEMGQELKKEEDVLQQEVSQESTLAEKIESVLLNEPIMEAKMDDISAGQHGTEQVVETEEGLSFVQTQSHEPSESEDIADEFSAQLGAADLDRESENVTEEDHGEEFISESNPKFSTEELIQQINTAAERESLIDIEGEADNFREGLKVLKKVLPAVGELIGYFGEIKITHGILLEDVSGFRWENISQTSEILSIPDDILACRYDFSFDKNKFESVKERLESFSKENLEKLKDAVLPFADIVDTPLFNGWGFFSDEQEFFEKLSETISVVLEKK